MAMGAAKAPAKAAAKAQHAAQAGRQAAPPTATQPRAAGPGHAPTTVVVFLDKTGGGSLGLEVVQDPRGRVLIQAVNGGLASQWNAENFESRIAPGDCIVEVNGVTGEASAMLERCRVDDILMVTLEKGS